LKELAAFKKLAHLELSGAQVTDESLRVLCDLGLVHTLGQTRPRWRDPVPKTDAEVVALDLSGAGLTDGGMKELARLKNLTFLDVRKTQVSGAGLRDLAPLKKLVTLHLDREQMTDATLHNLRAAGLLHALADAKAKGNARPRSADEVHVLTLNGTLTDAGLLELVGLKNLTELHLVQTNVSDAGITRLRKALPECRIFIDMPAP
jgi:hypothetical protein